MQAKYNADKNLASRTGFKWTILRPGGLTNEPGTGKGHIGKAHLGRTISVSGIYLISRVRVRCEDGIDVVIVER